VFGIILLLLSAALPWFFPVVHLPQPTGPFSVGTASLHLVDSSRAEDLTEELGDKRELMARIWYPAEPASGAKPMPYWEKADIIGPIRVKDDFRKWGLTWMPAFFFNHFSLMKTDSYPDAPISEAQMTYPVIIFSPGGGVIHEFNFLHVEELASHGYVVMSLSHPYESWAAIFPDGRVVRGKFLKAKTEKTKEDEENEKKAQELVERLKKSQDIQERKAMMREFFAMDPDQIMETLLEVRVRDVRFALDELGRMNSGQRPSPFQGKLDLERAGVFGMSLGGAVTGQVCLEDARFKAGINLDGTQFGDLIDSSISQPFMFMNSGESKDHNDFVYDRMKNFTYSVTVKGSSHMDFTDMFFTSPAFKKFSKTAIPNKRMNRVANAYILAFFDKYLKGKEAPLLAGPSEDYPEVTFKIVSRPD
jgi:predicted dienelactone hydrolase